MVTICSDLRRRKRIEHPHSPSVTLARSMVNALKAAGAEPRYTEYPGVGHNSYEKAFSDPELVEWLFTHRAHNRTQSPP